MFKNFFFRFKIEGEDHLKKKQLTELAILKGTYRDPNLLSKNFNQIPIGAPLILTSHIQQDCLPTQNQTQQILTTIPQTSFNESNFLQIFTPVQTIDQMGGLLTNETHLFEYSNQTGKMFYFYFKCLFFFSLRLKVKIL